MKRQLLLQHRLRTLSALQDAIEAMRSLAAHHFRRARQALGAARDYRSEMDSVISEIGINQPLNESASCGLLVVASDMGLCGDYNVRLSRLGISEAQAHGKHKLYSVGRRARSNLIKHQLVPDRVFDAPASLDGLSHSLLDIAQEIFDDYLSQRIGSLYVVSASFEGVGHFTARSTRVLPVQPIAEREPLRRSPYISSDYLAVVAVREYLYITLYEILLDALAAEHGMRLTATESALEWLEDTAKTTSWQLVAARSEAATQELLDIVAGSRKKPTSTG